MLQTLCIIGALSVEVDEIKAAVGANDEFIVGGNIKAHESYVNGIRVIICCCGVGKVFSAAAAAALLTRVNSIDAVINVGVAGGVGQGLKQGDIVLADLLVQHDCDSTCDGLKKGQIQGREDVFFKADEKLKTRMSEALQANAIPFVCGTIASGDQFINSKEKVLQLRNDFNALACDMESASIAHVCEIFNVPFVALRAISDGGDDGALMDFYSFLTRAAISSTNAICTFLNSLK